MRSIRAILPLLLVACGIDVVGFATTTSPDAGMNELDATTSASSSSSSSGQTTSSSSSSSGEVVDAGRDADAEVDPDPCVASPALVLCLPFENDASDRSPKQRALEVSNLSFAAGRRGQAARFTSSPKTDVRVPYAAELNEPITTIEFWLNPSSLPGGADQRILVDMDGRFGIYLNADATVSCRQTKLPPKLVVDEWTHVACVNDGTTLFGYVNGKLEGQTQQALGTTSNWIGIGQDSPSMSRNFEGLLDEVRIWTEARTPDQIKAAATR